MATETKPNPLVKIYADFIYYQDFDPARVPEYLQADVASLLATYPSDPYFDDHRHHIADVDGLQGELDAKETPDGSQAKADAALSTARQYTVTKLAEMVDGSPEALDTLYEIAAALNNDPDFATNIINQLAGKVDKEAGKALFSGSYADLSDKPEAEDIVFRTETEFDSTVQAELAEALFWISAIENHLAETDRHRRILTGTGAPPAGLEDGSVYFRYE
ncbi:hypothetical protein [Planomicrobium sp. YIM 101495]|uniref:hypothetical protein n=1 Tax=Planomicrobium sp. YIM 101495 TaxID=2665160 RepID=UPI0012B8B105|nr:hypothetical protein [Planomicrobium sp. YIM 101495]MTD30146.1 hypothetical protein [Planomicrobium sp. YIM 101495]